MAQAIRSWIDRLSSKALPAMALTQKRLPQLLNSPNSTNADLQRIISRDPGFSLVIYRKFSELPYPPKAPITNLAHAIALLGIETLNSASNQLPVLNELLKGDARSALYNCYSRAGHAAWYAMSWGNQLRINNPDEMAISALLFELGEMMMWSHAEQEMSQIIALERRGMTRATAEQTILGFELNELSLQLAERWRLPSLLTEALRPAGAFQVRSLTVMLAAGLARESLYNWYSEQTQDLIELAAELNVLSLDQGLANCHSLSAGAARNLSGLPIPLSAFGLLQPRPNTAKQTTQPINKETAADSAPPRQKSIDVDTVPIKPMQPIGAGKPNSTSLPLKRTNPLQERLTRLFHDLRESTGVDRVMFALLNSEQTQLRVKFIVGADKESPLRTFQHDMGERDLFTLMMRKPQGIWLNRENQVKITPLISQQCQSTLDTRGFYMNSLFVNNRPLGILYADRKDPEFLDKHGFSQFKSLAQRLCNELGQKR